MLVAVKESEERENVEKRLEWLEAMNERAWKLLRQLSWRKTAKRIRKNILSLAVKVRIQKHLILKFVAGHLSTMQIIYCISDIGGVELPQPLLL